eukprot:994902_1
MPSFCATCNNADATSVCSACKCTYYCNSYCQRKDWKQHKQMCQMLKDIQNVSIDIVQEDEEEEKKSTTHTNEEQTYKKRIDNVLRVIERQREECDQLQGQDIYALVAKEYAKNNGI